MASLKALVGRGPETIGNIEWWGQPISVAVSVDLKAATPTIQIGGNSSIELSDSDRAELKHYSEGDTIFLAAPEFTGVYELQRHSDENIAKTRSGFSAALVQPSEIQGRVSGTMYRLRSWPVYEMEALPESGHIQLARLRNVDRRKFEEAIAFQEKQDEGDRLIARGKIQILKEIESDDGRKALLEIGNAWQAVWASAVRVDEADRKTWLKANGLPKADVDGWMKRIKASPIKAVQAAGDVVKAAIKDGAALSIDLSVIDNEIAIRWMEVPEKTDLAALTPADRAIAEAEIQSKVQALLGGELVSIRDYNLAEIDRSGRVSIDVVAAQTDFAIREIEILCQMPEGRMRVMDIPGWRGIGQGQVEEIYTAIVEMEEARLLGQMGVEEGAAKGEAEAGQNPPLSPETALTVTSST